MPSLIEKMFLLPGAILALCHSHALAYELQKRDSNSMTSPAPISIAPEGKWDGIDGSWSSFSVKIGSPPQDVRTFVSWSVYQTWAVLPEGCAAAEDEQACAQKRGGLLNEKTSSSFKKEGTYYLSVGETLGLYGNAYYGYDTVSLQSNSGSGPTVDHALVAGYALQDFYVGMFGVNPEPTNFSKNDQSPSYMTLLKEQNQIPSLSFGYTAGAHYRSDSSLASLTLGGYDKSKFIKNPVTFNFSSDNELDIIVGVQSIYTPSKDPASPVPIELLPTPIYAYVDALVPEIWLPLDACQDFEFEFGLEYDNDTELYLVNNTLHQSLLERNASITFQLGMKLDGGVPVKIELPYAAFDLTASSPYHGLSTNTRYFPLRRAANESQYFIGRTFFQEAYISVDYERQQFNISQRNWDSNGQTQLMGIPALQSNSSLNKSSGSGLSGGAIAGIVVGAVAVIALLAILIMWYFIRRRKTASVKGEKLGSETGSTNNDSPSRRGQESNVIPKVELEGSAPFEVPTLASGALSNDSSNSGPDTPRSAHHLSGSMAGLRSGWVSDSPNNDSPVEGTATYSSSDTNTSASRYTGNGSGSGSGSGGAGTVNSLVSPISPPDSQEAAEADSKPRPVYEMVGDMPKTQEKDGKQLSEKEAMAYREMVYNGVDTPVEPPSPAVNFSRSSLQGPRRLYPEDVTNLGTVLDAETEPRDFRRHRAFSFEDNRKEEGTEELYE